MDSKVLFLLCLASVSLAWVTPEDQCGPHAVYMTCGACQPTCRDVFPMCDKCQREGCYCVPPFVFHENECIIYTDCPKNATVPAQEPEQCLQNEELMECGCEHTCSSPLDRTCANEICKGFGCYCPAPFVRHNGKCIKVNECPKSMLVAHLMRH
ncbi:hypothetical protein L596_021500 [Steinernema carpocapsae]|uniref:TIL domain-containing protein n=1 Tax=Steinernema carpocapsae TaxID=34508 RepID=A0A4U5MIY7_STECR|nr:hypothetical protein L596_021500 [Steinernema carpocapsae]